MIGFLMRMAAVAALAVAVVLAVIDATRSVDASRPVTTSLGATWQAWSPGTLPAIGPGAGTSGIAASTAEIVLALPGFAVFLALALIFHSLGRRPLAGNGRIAGAGRAPS